MKINYSCVKKSCVINKNNTGYGGITFCGLNQYQKEKTRLELYYVHKLKCNGSLLLSSLGSTAAYQKQQPITTTTTTTTTTKNNKKEEE